MQLIAITADVSATKKIKKGKNTMKKKLTDIPRGAVFKFRGMKWILLEHTPQGGSLALAKDIVCNKPFDEDNCNNFAKSSIRKYLNGEFAETIGVTATDFMPYELDLTADDGTTYGKCTDRVLLLTTDIYRRNRDVIEPIDEWWWTATAYSTLAAYSCNVRSVSTDGTLSNYDAHYGNGGVRPLCHLNSGILVEIGETGEEISAERAGEIAKKMFEERSVKIDEKQFRLAIAVALKVFESEQEDAEVCEE